MIPSPLCTHLAPPDVGALEVGVKEEVEVEGDVLAGVVDAHIHVEFLLAQDEAVRHAEGAVPEGARVLAVRQAEDGLHVARVQPVGALVQLPSVGVEEIVVLKLQMLIHQFLVSIVVSIPACHAGDRGSIPRRGGTRFAILPAILGTRTL